jgi:hypothetical protein
MVRWRHEHENEAARLARGAAAARLGTQRARLETVRHRRGARGDARRCQPVAQASAAGGVEALRRHPAPGPIPKLTAEQLAQIPGLLSRAPDGTTFEQIEANGLPALLIRVKGHIVSVLTLDVEGEFIRAVRSVVNPDKLAHLTQPPTSGQEWRIRS